MKISLIVSFILCIFFIDKSIQWGRERPKPVEKDLYKLLELTKKASQEDIKSQYRKLTRKYHPDKKEGNKELYTEINEAYEILSDQNKRRIYDSKGYEAAKNAGARNNDDDDDDIMSFFGRGMKKENQMEDQRIKLRVTLNDLYNGKEYHYKYTKNIICPHCRGSGAESDDDVHVCPKCSGQGVVIERRQIGPGFIQQFQTTCPKCGGKGRTITKSCHVCKSEKIVPHIEEMSVFVEKGMSEGQDITFEDSADESPDKRAGNLVFIINEIKHKQFTRNGNDLSTELEISLKEALLGFKKELIHLDGRSVVIETAKVTQPGYVFRMNGEGMPIHNRSWEFGDLYVKINVKLPSELTSEQIEIAKRLFSRK